MSGAATMQPIPDFALILLAEAPRKVRSKFAHAHFDAAEIVSADSCRTLLGGEAGSPEAVRDAMQLLHQIVDMRLRRRRLTFVDASDFSRVDRQLLLACAKRHYTQVVSFVLQLTEQLGSGSPGESGMVNSLRRDGFRDIRAIGALPDRTTRLPRQPLPCDKREMAGPFDIIGDVHGCTDELEELLANLGYRIETRKDAAFGTCYAVTPPPGRTAIFVGDLVDRGPRVGDTLRLVMDMVASGSALCVVGNHEARLLRWLRGRNLDVKYGLDATLRDFETAGDAFKARVKAFIEGLVSHYVLDRGWLAVAHAGIKADMLLRDSGSVRAFCLYGEATGEMDADGFPVRLDWAESYRGETQIVYGHTVVALPEWRNGTLCIDTGCVFGGSLTALRYPELDLVSVSARANYCAPVHSASS